MGSALINPLVRVGRSCRKSIDLPSDDMISVTFNLKTKPLKKSFVPLPDKLRVVIVNFANDEAVVAKAPIHQDFKTVLNNSNSSPCHLSSNKKALSATSPEWGRPIPVPSSHLCIGGCLGSNEMY